MVFMEAGGWTDLTPARAGGFRKFGCNDLWHAIEYSGPFECENRGLTASWMLARPPRKALADRPCEGPELEIAKLPSCAGVWIMAPQDAESIST
jgi:hypothetical protein